MSPSPDRPFDRCYWVLPGRFLAGAHPANCKAETQEIIAGRLLDCGIRRFLNLTEANDEIDPQGHPFASYAESLQRIATERAIRIACHRAPIPDFGVITREEMQKILDKIESWMASGEPVYIHCLAGIGRTGLVVGCYLAHHNIAHGEDAIRMIARLRSDTITGLMQSPETETQRAMVRNW